jgi:ADP-heptose:LPS heptosyltransferase
LGIVNPRPRFDLAEDPDAEIAAARILQLMHLDRGFAVINPGAGFPSKLWPTSRYCEVARHLGQTRKLRSLVVWAGAQERIWAEEIVAGSAGFAALAPTTSLNELAAIARRARLFVASDTGPLHLAAAVGTPCVGLFGPVAEERNGPYGSQHVSVQKMWLPPAHPRRRTERETMRAITVEDVVAACERILDRVHVERRSA